MFVHFTVALLSLSVLFFILQRPLAETLMGDNFLVFARYALGLGIFFTIITVIAGWDAYNTVNHDTPSHQAMNSHRLWALITFTIFLVAWLWSLAIFKTQEKAPVFFLLLLLIAFVFLVNTGHKGSELVYSFGLGVEALPAADDHDHATHSHESHESHDHDHAAHSHDDEQKKVGVPEGMEMDSIEGIESNNHDEKTHQHNEIPTAPSESSPEKTSSESAIEIPVEIDKDGISRQPLPAVDVPGSQEAATPGDAPTADEHSHQH